MLGNEEVVAAVSGDLTQAGSVAALSVRGNFMFDPATHRDFLGALLGTGIERQKVLSAWQSHGAFRECASSLNDVAPLHAACTLLFMEYSVCTCLCIAGLHFAGHTSYVTGKC